MVYGYEVAVAGIDRTRVRHPVFLLSDISRQSPKIVCVWLAGLGVILFALWRASRRRPEE